MKGKRELMWEGEKIVVRIEKNPVATNIIFWAIFEKWFTLDISTVTKCAKCNICRNLFHGKFWSYNMIYTI